MVLKATFTGDGYCDEAGFGDGEFSIYVIFPKEKHTAN